MAEKSVVKTRSSGRVRKPPTTFTPSKNPHVKVDYELDRKKAIQKKAAAASRSYDLDIEDKRGTLVLTFSTAAYEIFRHELVSYLERKADITVDKTPKISASNDVVEDSYSVYLKGNPQLLYRVNLFHTTSRADVNGKGYDVFIIEDLPRLRQKLENYSDLVELNSKIKQWCQNYLQAFQARNNATTSHVIASQSDTVATSGSISNNLDSCNTRLASDNNKVIATSQLCIPSVKNTSHSNAVSILKDDSQQRRDIDTSVAIVDRVPTSAVSRSVTDTIARAPVTQNASNAVAIVSCAPNGISTRSITDTIGRVATTQNANSAVSHIATATLCNTSVTVSRTPIVSTGMPSSAITQCASNTQDKNASKKEKSSELRTREDKIRKKEEELVIREAALREKELRQVHLESYIEKLEARNTELDKSLRLLKRRLSAYEDDNIHSNDFTQQSEGSQPPPRSHRNDSQTTLVHKIHERVTNFVLNKIDKELDVLLQPQNQCNENFVNTQKLPSADTQSTSTDNGPYRNSYIGPDTHCDIDTSRVQMATDATQPRRDTTSTTHSTVRAAHTQASGIHHSGHSQYTIDDPQQFVGQPVYYQQQPFLGFARPVRPYQ